MTLIIISWVIFGIMAAFMLSYTKDLQHHQVLGVTLSDSHRETTEVQDIIKGYKRVCFLLFLLFIALSFLLFLPFARSYAEFFLLILVLVYFITPWLDCSYFPTKTPRTETRKRLDLPAKSHR